MSSYSKIRWLNSRQLGLIVHLKSQFNYILWQDNKPSGQKVLHSSYVYRSLRRTCMWITELYVDYWNLNGTSQTPALPACAKCSEVCPATQCFAANTLILNSTAVLSMFSHPPHLWKPLNVKWITSHPFLYEGSESSTSDYQRGSGAHLCRCFAVRVRSRGDAHNFGLFCHQMVVSSLLEVEKSLKLWTNTLIQIHHEGCCSKVRSSLLLVTHSPTWSPRLGAGIVQASWLVSASMGGAHSLALCQATTKGSRRGKRNRRV